MNLSLTYKKQVKEELFKRRPMFGGTNGQFGKIYGISASIFSRLNNGEIDGLMSNSQWLNIGRELGVNIKTNNWKVVRTKVYDEIESSIKFCQEFSRSMVLVDDCGIGKTFCAKHIAKSLRNAFYIDCSQSKNKQAFVRHFAKALGIDVNGKYIDVKENLKYYINQLESPVFVLDEVGDLEYTAFLELKELWNSADGNCGWLMMGADGLRNKIQKGISNKKVGFAEIFSRFSDEFIQLTPNGVLDRQAFYHELLTQVATANHTGTQPVETLVKQCLKKEATLRHMETLIKISA